MKEPEIIPEYVQIGISIGKDRIAYLSLPKDVTPQEIKQFIKQCKQIRQKPC
jgi:hypothetical protein